MIIAIARWVFIGATAVLSACLPLAASVFVSSPQMYLIEAIYLGCLIPPQTFLSTVLLHYNSVYSASIKIKDF